MTPSEDPDWPRAVAGHLIERDVHFSPGTGDVTEFRCVECGEVFDELDEKTLQRVPCSVQPAREDEDEALSPDPGDH